VTMGVTTYSLNLLRRGVLWSSVGWHIMVVVAALEPTGGQILTAQGFW